MIAIIYAISRYAGGAFFDFCAAIGWVDKRTECVNW
jgi:hypothetical protein